MSGEGRSSYYRHIFEAAKVSYTLQPQKVFLYSNGKKLGTIYFLIITNCIVCCYYCSFF
jgi:Na+-transporting NADH:ubiquinone oxidoreductase subunit NqrD